MSDKRLEFILKRGVAEIIVEEELRRQLDTGKKRRLKMGFDPSRPDIHMGHVVGMRKLLQLQELGHQVVLIVGDWTAQIGDPSGMSQTRPMLSAEEVRANAETYMQQFFKVVDKEKTEVRWQSEGFGKVSLAAVIRLTSKFTGLMGRELQQMIGQPRQQVFLMHLLVGTDGQQKMSKSLGNYIAVEDPPNEMYGKVMSIPDSLLMDYFELLTDVPEKELADFRQQLASQSVNPMMLKKRLAKEIVAQFHSAGAAGDAESHFEKVVQKKEAPEEIKVVSIY